MMKLKIIRERVSDGAKVDVLFEPIREVRFTDMLRGLSTATTVFNGAVVEHDVIDVRLFKSYPYERMSRSRGTCLTICDDPSRRVISLYEPGQFVKVSDASTRYIFTAVK